MTLTPIVNSFSSPRISNVGPDYEPDPDSLPDEARPQQRPDELEDDFWEREHEWREQYRREHLVQPEPGVFKEPEIREDMKGIVMDLKKDFDGKGLQVIVKLATICLTPEKSSYEGGSWHVEGQMASGKSP